MLLRAYYWLFGHGNTSPGTLEQFVTPGDRKTWFIDNISDFPRQIIRILLDFVIFAHFQTIDLVCIFCLREMYAPLPLPFGFYSP